MELFATERERLAFLIETDAALDLGFEALEVQVEADVEEPSPEKRPKYITNPIGRSRSWSTGYENTRWREWNPRTAPSLVRRLLPLWT